MNPKKLIPAGGDLIIAKQWWPETCEGIHGDDKLILEHPMMEYAFQQVLKLHKPKHKTVLFSLCTATRPYSLSRKWKKYVELFDGKCDMVVCSNGGLIPLEFENQFPYLNYDAKGASKFNAIYIKKLEERLDLFLRTHSYENVVFNFRHNLRNVVAANTVAPKAQHEGVIRQYAIIPSKETYMQGHAEGFIEAGFKMYPELWPTMLDPLIAKVQEFQ